jgi:DNA processing protein
MNPRIEAWLRLSALKDVGVASVLKLAERLGEPEEFVGRGMEPLKGASFLNPAVCQAIASAPPLEERDRVARLCDKYDIHFVSILDDEYPPLLKAIYYPPPFFFYRGELRREAFRRTLAVVGTRHSTYYGRDLAARIVKDLARAGFTIVSGLALGIDSVAHRVAVENDAYTVAVMGTGCETIYPESNRELAKDILANGCLISEFVPGSEPGKANFPRRNRIISGLSLGTLVVEGARQSGALITSKYAVDQNRVVFATPGDVTREQSEGPNHLIKMGAKLVTCGADILEEFDMPALDQEQIPIFPELNPAEEKVYNLLVDNRPDLDFDNLYIKAGMSISELSGVLLGLDLKGVIRRLPGNRLAPAY